MAKAVTNTQHYTDIANAIRSRTGKSGALKPSQMAAEIQDIPEYLPKKWVRPQELPDYSKVIFSNTDEVLYLTYDTQLKDMHHSFVSFTINGTATIVEWGTLNNGAFTAAGTVNLGSDGTYRAWLPTNLGRYIVYKVRPAQTGHITRYYLNYSDPVVNDRRVSGQRQPLIEVYCRLPYLTTLYGYLISQYTLSFTHFGAISVTSMYTAFAYGYCLEHIYFESLNTANCTSFQGAFRNCYILEDINLDLTVTNKCTNLAQMFYGMRRLKQIPFDLQEWDVSNVTSLADTFSGCSSVQHLDVSNWQTGKVTQISATFNNCYSLRQLDVSNWDVSKVTSMSNTFNTCAALIELDLSKWEAPLCNTVYYMFGSCLSLQEVDLSHLNTELITNARYLFYNCGALVKVKVGNLVHNKCTDLREIFSSATQIIEIDGIDTWDTSGATMVTSCFYNANNLVHIDISQWDLSNVTAIANTATMFRYCYGLETLKLPSTLKYCGSYFAGNIDHIREYHFTSTTPATLTDNNSITKYAATKIYVPVGSLNAYKTAWPAFADNIFEEGT